MKIKMSPELLYLISTVIGAILVFIASLKDGQQKQRIENLGKETVKLTTEVHKLELLNAQINGQIEEMVKGSSKISQENYKLSQENKELIVEVNKLTDQSKKIIDQINSSVIYDAAQNLKTGELPISWNLKLGEKIMINVGGLSFNYKIDSLENSSPRLFAVGDADPVVFKFADNRLLISCKVFDEEGKLIAEVENNFWRPNSNFTGKFNYDESGFEVIDNQGRTAFNIEIRETNEIAIQGIFIFRDEGLVLFAGKSVEMMPTKTPQSEAQTLKSFGRPYNIIFKEHLKAAQITQLFEYTGKDWLHKRKHAPDNQ